jgi:hypothetical protein
MELAVLLYVAGGIMGLVDAVPMIAVGIGLYVIFAVS